MGALTDHPRNSKRSLLDPFSPNFKRRKSLIPLPPPPSSSSSFPPSSSSSFPPSPPSSSSFRPPSGALLDRLSPNLKRHKSQMPLPPLPKSSSFPPPCPLRRPVHGPQRTVRAFGGVSSVNWEARVLDSFRNPNSVLENEGLELEEYRILVESAQKGTFSSLNGGIRVLDSSKNFNFVPENDLGQKSNFSSLNGGIRVLSAPQNPNFVEENESTESKDNKIFLESAQKGYFSSLDGEIRVLGTPKNPNFKLENEKLQSELNDLEILLESAQKSNFSHVNGEIRVLGAPENPNFTPENEKLKWESKDHRILVESGQRTNFSPVDGEIKLLGSHENLNFVPEDERLELGEYKGLVESAQKSVFSSFSTDLPVLEKQEGRLDFGFEETGGLGKGFEGRTSPVYRDLLFKAKERDGKLSQLEFEVKLAEKRISEFSFVSVEKPEEDLLGPFTPLSDEVEEEVRLALRDCDKLRLPKHEVLVTHEASNIEITRDIIQCLRHGAWLNDEVINLYFELLKEREKREPKKFVKSHFFNTFFYKKLTGGRGNYDFKSVRRWTTQRKLGYGLIECDKIFVPIHKEIHWCLAVIDVKNEKLLYLDSLGGWDGHVLSILERYLMDEVKDKSNMSIDVTSWKKEKLDNLPLQKNGWDCGMFMIKYVDFITRGLGLCFQQDNMTYFRKRTAKEILKLRAE